MRTFAWYAARSASVVLPGVVGEPSLAAVVELIALAQRMGLSGKVEIGGIPVEERQAMADLMIANRLIAGVTGVKLNDYGCALKAYRTDLVKIGRAHV